MHNTTTGTPKQDAGSGGGPTHRRSGGACSTRVDARFTQKQLRRRQPQSADVHGLQRRNVAFTRGQSVKALWRVWATRRSSVDLAAETPGSRGGRRRGTRLGGACLTEVDRRA